MKKEKQKPVALEPPISMTEYGERFVRLGAALQDGSTRLRDLVDLSDLCGCVLRFSIISMDKEEPKP